MTEFGIVKLHEMLEKKKITKDELIAEAIKKSHDVNELTNAFVTICDDAKSDKDVNTMLSGIPFGVKDNYSTANILTTGSSNTLKDYVPFFDATCVKKLKDAGAVIVNKTAMDEFGMGGTGTTAHTGVQKNPWDLERMCGGSSSGSAAAVASGVYPFALGSDTGDSIRKPAGFCGIIGYKPTYGMISRFGLFPFASSLDHCGVLTRSVEDAAIVVDYMKGKDELDQTTWDSKDLHLYQDLNKDKTNYKLFYIKEIVDYNNYPNITDELKSHLDNFYNTLDLLKKDGIKVEEVSIDKKLLEAIPSVYMCISCAEATSNMSNLTGISFGPRSNKDNFFDMIDDYRTKGFSPLIKRRFVIGSYVLQRENQEKYFLNAARVRRLIVDKFKNLFKVYDACIMPVSTGVAPFLNGKKDELIKSDVSVLENHLQIGNFGGFPSITIPNGIINNLPVGINITSNNYKDQDVLNIAYLLESKMNYKDMIAGGKNE